MTEMLGSLDEKNHALAMANDALDRLLGRADSAWPQIEREISEETRWGRLDHWAYTDRSADNKKNAIIGERTRREVAMANSLAAAAEAHEAGPSRTDTRTKTRKAQAPADSDRDDAGRQGKKAAVNNKRSKPAESPATHPATLNGGANKRRKVEKPAANMAAGGLIVERAMSTVFGSNIRGGGSPRETPAAEAAKKKGRAGQGATGTNNRRRFAAPNVVMVMILTQSTTRAGTVNSSVNSPNPASSPIVGTFATAMKANANTASGVPMQRTTSARLRQNSAQLAPHTNKSLPAATDPHNGPVGLGLSDAPANSTSAALKNGNDTKAKAEPNPTGNHEGRPTSRGMKREDSASARQPRPPSISTAPRSAGGKASKTGTPVVTSFADHPTGQSSPSNGPAAGPPPRSARSNNGHSAAHPRAAPAKAPSPASGRPGGLTPPAPPLKRSHKKGAGLQAQLHAQHAAAATRRGDVVGMDGASSAPEEEEEDGVEGNEPRYCYCNGVSYGQMIACDMDDCAREWFHLECAGLSRPPTAKCEFHIPWHIACECPSALLEKADR